MSIDGFILIYPGDPVNLYQLNQELHAKSQKSDLRKCPGHL
jgi:hypothetical protein